MKNIIIFFFLFLSINVAFSQVAVGLKYDINGMPFDGYYDALTYKANNKITFVNANVSFEDGHYYDSFGHKVEGLIQFDNHKYFYKKFNNDSKIKLTATDVYSMVIGVDSFFATNNFHLKNKLIEKDEFVQFIAEINDLTFVKYYQKIPKISQGYGIAYKEIYFVKSKHDLYWDSFKDDNFYSNSAKYFKDFPLIKIKLRNDEFSKSDIFSMIKMADYIDKFNKSENILYNKYWQETIDKSNYKYFAKIIVVQDSIWTFNYFKDDIKIYKVNYSSFYPAIKTGDLICYLPNGDVRKIITYDENQVKDVKVFDKNKLSRHYVFSGEEGNIDLDRNLSMNYKSVYDTLGHNILKEVEKTIFSIFDSEFNVSYTNIVVSEKLKSAFRLFENDTVFQITNPSYDFNLDKLQVRFNDYLIHKRYSNAERENAQGTILVSLIIDNKGFVVDASTLNQIHPEFDFIVNGFVNDRLLSKYDYGFKFKPIKMAGKKRFFEIVIPFEFSTNRFYRAPVNYYHYNNNWNWNWHWQNTMMHHQQFINNIKPPSFPSTF